MDLSGDLSNVSITSARLTRKSFTPADATETFAAGTPRIAKFMSWNPPASEADHRALCCAIQHSPISGAEGTS